MSDEEVRRLTDRYNAESALKQARTRAKGESKIKKFLEPGADILYTGSKQLVENVARNAGQEIGKRIGKSITEQRATNYDQKYKMLKNKHDVELAKKGIFRDSKDKSGDGVIEKGSGDKKDFKSAKTLGRTFTPKSDDSSDGSKKRKPLIDDILEKAESKRRDDSEKERYRSAMSDWVKEIDDREAEKAAREYVKRRDEREKWDKIWSGGDDKKPDKLGPAAVLDKYERDKKARRRKS